MFQVWFFEMLRIYSYSTLSDIISTFDDIPMKRRFWLLSFWFFHWGIPGSAMANRHHFWVTRSFQSSEKKIPEAYVESYWVLAFDHAISMNFPWNSSIPVLVIMFSTIFFYNHYPQTVFQTRFKKNTGNEWKIPQYHVISATKAERLDVALQSPSAGVSRQVAWHDHSNVRRDTVILYLTYSHIVWYWLILCSSVDIIYIYIYNLCNMICRIYIYIY